MSIKDSILDIFVNKFTKDVKSSLPIKVTTGIFIIETISKLLVSILKKHNLGLLKSLLRSIILQCIDANVSIIKNCFHRVQSNHLCVKCIFPEYKVECFNVHSFTWW